MVDGCDMVFSAQMMIDKCINDGHTLEELKSMDGVFDNLKRLDGCEVTSSSWARQVMGEPVYFVLKDKNGNKGCDVPDVCCIYKSQWKPCELLN